MAMEDSVTLAVALEGASDVEGSLARFQDMRMVRTARVQMNSSLIGDYIYRPDDARAAVRTEVMRAMSPQD